MSETAPSIRFTVFTKRWKMPLAELGELVAGLGFWGVELPVRPGYQVEPDRVAAGLPEAARILGQAGVKIHSVAGPTNEATIAACAEVGAPVLRVMAYIGEESYLAAETRLRHEYDALLGLLEKYGVTLGIQNHCDEWVGSAIGLRRLIEPYDPRYIAAVWDPAHCALNGEPPYLAADIVWDRLCLVNLKNAFWRLQTGPEAEVARWEWYWTTGRRGLAHWPSVAAELKKRSYRGVVCLSAEYSDEAAGDRLIADDIAFAKSLLV